jgi:hypothetical protein
VATYTVAAHQSRIDAVLSRASGVDDLQTQADLARYLCVLVAGHLEQAVRHIYSDYAVNRLSGFTNANAERLCSLAGAFDPQWRKDLEDFLGDQRKDAINSVIANRHQIVHGQDVGITYIRIRDYYAHVRDAVAYLEAQCA